MKYTVEEGKVRHFGGENRKAVYYLNNDRLMYTSHQKQTVVQHEVKEQIAYYLSCKWFWVQDQGYLMKNYTEHC